jgi:hypothetical protein
MTNFGDEKKKTSAILPFPNPAQVRVAQSRNKIALRRDGAASWTRQQHVPIVLHSASRWQDVLNSLRDIYDGDVNTYTKSIISLSKTYHRCLGTKIWCFQQQACILRAHNLLYKNTGSKSEPNITCHSSHSPVGLHSFTTRVLHSAVTSFQFTCYFINEEKVQYFGKDINTCINPLTPKLNPSAQLCQTRIFSGDFAAWTVHLIKIYAWKPNKCNNYSFILLMMYGSSYMFRHYIAIFRERS